MRRGRRRCREVVCLYVCRDALSRWPLSTSTATPSPHCLASLVRGVERDSYSSDLLYGHSDAWSSKQVYQLLEYCYPAMLLQHCAFAGFHLVACDNCDDCDVCDGERGGFASVAKSSRRASSPFPIAEQSLSKERSV